MVYNHRSSSFHRFLFYFQLNDHRNTFSDTHCCMSASTCFSLAMAWTNPLFVKSLTMSSINVIYKSVFKFKLIPSQAFLYKTVPQMYILYCVASYQLINNSTTCDLMDDYGYCSYFEHFPFKLQLEWFVCPKDCMPEITTWRWIISTKSRLVQV